ncbi:MAG: helix-hairpin-helix domain-containing protein [Acidimicrobiia bacterium]
MAPLEPHVPSFAGWWASFRVSLTRSRLVGVVLAAVALGAGAWWLLRPAQPPVELTLPRATTPGASAPAAGSGSSAAVAGATTTVTTVFVQVAGAVRRPGVYAVRTGARVTDVVDAAGGPTPEADVDAIALAIAVTDGQRVYVPKKGEPLPAVQNGAAAAAGATPSAGGGAATAGGLVDLNRATTADLDTLPGIGPSLAAAIVSYRDKHGRFRQVEDLNQVPGIGAAKLEAIRSLVTVRDA